MTAGALHPIVRCDVLEHIARPLLVRLLEADRDFLASHGIALSALAASSQEDRALVRRVFALVDSPDGAPSPAPPAMRDRLSAVSALASPAGREAIARADVDARVDRAHKSDEDVAALVVLDHPDVLARARPGLAVQTVNGYTAYRAADDRDIDFVANKHAIEQGFGLYCKARDRIALCTLFIREGARFVEVDVTHGRTPAARDHVDPATLKLRQSTDHTTQSAKMVFDKKERCLLVHAGHASLKDGLRRVVGEVCTGDPDFFTTRALYDLSPLAHAVTFALGADVPNVTSIELRALTVRAHGGVPVAFGPSPTSLHGEPWGALVAQAFALGAPTAVKIALRLGGRNRASVVEIRLPGTLEYVRRDHELSRAVGDFLVARGIAVLEERAAVPALAAQ